MTRPDDGAKRWLEYAVALVALLGGMITAYSFASRELCAKLDATNARLHDVEARCNDTEQRLNAAAQLLAVLRYQTSMPTPVFDSGSRGRDDSDRQAYLKQMQDNQKAITDALVQLVARPADAKPAAPDGAPVALSPAPAKAPAPQQIDASTKH